MARNETCVTCRCLGRNAMTIKLSFSRLCGFGFPVAYIQVKGAALRTRWEPGESNDGDCGIVREPARVHDESESPNIPLMSLPSTLNCICRCMMAGRRRRGP